MKMTLEKLRAFQLSDADGDTFARVDTNPETDSDIFTVSVGDAEGTAYADILKIGGDTTGFIWNDAGAALDALFKSDDDENVLKIVGAKDTVLMGTDVEELTMNGVTVIPKLHVLDGAGDANVSFIVRSDSDTDTQGAFCLFARSRSGLSGVNNGDRIGVFRFDGHDDTEFITTGLIQAVVDGTRSTGIIPTCLEFYNMDSAGSNNRNMLITPAGNVGINDNNPTVRLSVDGDVTINESKADKDIVFWGTSAAAIWHDAGNKRLRFGETVNGDLLELWATKTEFNRTNNDVNLQVRTLGNNNTLFIDGGNDRAGILTGTPAAALHVNQSNATDALPAVQINQDDVDEPFIKLVGTAASADLTRNIVDVADVTTATIAGYVKIEVQDDGNRITDQDYFIPVYTLV